MLRPRQFVTLMMLILLSSATGLAQNKSKIKQLTPTLQGSTGLFNVYVADSLRQGEFSLGIGMTKFHREPGDIDIAIFPVTFTLGLHDRVEIFGSYEAYKRVNADQIRVAKIGRNAPIRPSQLRTGLVAFYNDTPFMDVGFGDGAGDLWAGVKFTLFSERLGAPIGLAIQPKARFHLTDDRSHLLRGLTAGATDWGYDLIFSKNLPKGATFAANAGHLFAQDRLNVDRQHRFNYGIGFDSPLGTPAAHIIGEVIGSTFFGSRDTSTFTNPVSPVDGYIGLRFFPARWMTVGGAYNFNFRTIDEDFYGIDQTDRHGFLAQVTFQRKMNEPPTVECVAQQTRVTEGQSATIQVNVMDPDDDVVTVTWRASGGARITQRDDNSAVLDSTGLRPGTYTVTAEVSDGESSASCSVDVTVEKRKMAPTIACEPSAVSVQAGQSVTLTARASDPNNDPLTWSWSVNGQSVPNDSPSFEFGTAGRAPGTYRVQATVRDTDGMTASCEYTVTVTALPNRPPTVNLTLSRNDVIACESISATARAQDPDGDQLTYRWTVDGQSRSESGSQISIDTCGLIGQHSVTVSVNDGKGGQASDTETFTVRQEKIVIQVDRRLDNIAKAKLDEVAVRMQQDPRLRALITGHTDSTGSDEANQKAGLRRADMAKDYLVKQHNIDAGRIETRSAGESQPIASNDTQDGRKQNRRIEIELVIR